MKKLTFIISLIFAVSLSIKAQQVEHLDVQTFKEKVFDYTKHNKWKYEGSKPAIVDFYADWCRPCKYVSPFLEELAEEYGDKIKIYKVNTDQNAEVARAFKLRGIPAFLFIRADGKMKKKIGAMNKATFEHEINNYMQVQK